MWLSFQMRNKGGDAVKVWIVSNGEPLPIDAGGQRLRRMGLLASYLSGQGSQVHWFCSTFHHYDKKQRADANQDVQRNKHYWIHLLKAKGYQGSVSLARLSHQRAIAAGFLKKAQALSPPDVILATLAPLPFSKAAVRYGLEHQVPVIVDIRDLWPDLYKEMVPAGFSFLLAPYLYAARRGLTWITNRASSLWGVTPGFLQYGLNAAGRKQQPLDGVFHTAYPRWNHREAKKRFDVDWKPLGIHPDDFLVVFIGQLNRQFSFDPVIEAARLLAGQEKIRFVFCGGGEQAVRLKEKTKDIPVIWAGHKGEGELKSLLSAASLGLAPYRNSANFRLNAPNKFSEYLSASLPVLTSLKGTMAAYAKQYGCGGAYGDGQELAEMIASYAEGPDRYRLAREGGNRLYEDHFEAGQVMKAMGDRLKKVAEQGRQAR